VGVHVEVGVDVHLQFNSLHVVAAEVAVLVEALDTVAGVTVLALALVHAHALAELCAEHTLGVGVAGVGDVAAVADDGVTVTPILALVAVVAELAIGLGLLALAALHAADGAPGAVVPSVFIPVAAKPLGRQGILAVWHSGTTLSLVLHVAVVVHRVAALHDVVAVVTARTVVPGKVPPTETAGVRLGVGRKN